MSAFNLLVIFFLIPGILVLLRNVLAGVYLWQVKEFRLDRIAAHFYLEHADTRLKHIFSYVKIGLFTALVMYLISPYAVALLVALPLMFVIYFNESIIFVESLIGKRFLRPKFKSPRNLLLLLSSFILLLLPLLLLLSWANSLPLPEDTLYRGFTVKNFSPNFDVTELLPKEEGGILVSPFVILVLILAGLSVIILDALAFTVVSILVMVTEPLALIKRRMLIQRATAILASYPELKIVGITGSYGKTTTKEILYQLLKNKFKVAKTPKNNNTDVGVALATINGVKKDTQVLVVEMGAYTKGEIAKSAKLAPPDVSIVTGIDEQHVALFGGIENTIQAKYEIVEYLKPDGLAIFNGDNEYCIRMAEKTTKRKKIFFSISGSEQIITPTIEPTKAETPKTQFPVNQNIYARNVTLSKSGVNFELNYAGEKFKVQTNLKAKYYVSNLLASIIAANELGWEIKELVRIVNKTKFDLPYLNIYQGINESQVIDDGYNVNQVGMLSALDFLKLQKPKGKKWVMTQGIVELGKSKGQVYQEIAHKLVLAANGLLSTDKELIAAVRNEQKSFTCIEVDGAARFIVYYERYIGKGDLVLIEGAMPKTVLDYIYLKK